MDGQGVVCRSPGTSFPLLAHACRIREKAPSQSLLTQKMGRMFSQVNSTHRFWLHLPDAGYLNNKAAIQVKKEIKY